jgi:hypothetical protein
LSLLGLRTSFGPSSSGRLSSRVRKRRHDKEIEISSGETLKDLKKKIFTEFQIAAFDQNLFFEESKVRLDGDEKTLGELGVTPHSLILVRLVEDGGSSSQLCAYDLFLHHLISPLELVSVS